MRGPWPLILLLVGCHRPAAPAETQAQREERQYEQYRQPAHVIAGLALAAGMRVADVGAGRGFFTGRLAAAVGGTGHVTATDINGAALAAIPHLPGVETRLVRPDDPGLEAGAYDRILMAQVDQYLPDRTAYLRKLVRALSPHGFIAVANRLYYRAPLVAAATAAGLRVTPIPEELPGQFYLRLEPPR